MDAKLVGMLVRKQGTLVGYGDNPEKEKTYSVIYDIYDAYYKAGKELATKGIINKATEKRANRLLFKPPFYLKYLMKFEPFRKEATRRHAMMIETALHR